MIGTILKNRYCIVEQIGAGGEGRLYLARDLDLGVFWAVKEIPIENKKEAKLLRLLEHPSLPRMIDYVETKEVCYLVMEYIRGKSLGQLLREGRRFSGEKILKLGIEMAGMLQYLHSQTPPVYHGDLKPDNLMITEEERLYLVDFGSAVHGYSGIQKICRGTKGFAAPEQYTSQVNAVSDVYALGKTLLVMTGKNKWRVWNEFPGLWLVLHKCCARNPDRRFRGMKEVAQAMEKVLRKRKRQGALMMFVSLATAGLLLGAGSIFVYLYQAPEFEQALTEVTELYQEKAFLEGTEEQKAVLCQRIEEKLRSLLKLYPQKEEQKRLLLLLAANGEYREGIDRGGEAGNPEVYYQQLLMYDSGCIDGYGEYGLYLLRKGREKQARKLWDRYEEKRKRGQLEQGNSPNVKLWERTMEEMANGKT